jgi:hypothetical protein
MTVYEKGSLKESVLAAIFAASAVGGAIYFGKNPEQYSGQLKLGISSQAYQVKQEQRDLLASGLEGVLELLANVTSQPAQAYETHSSKDNRVN